MLTTGTASPPAALLQPLVQALGVTAHKDERHPLLTRKRRGRLEKYSAIPHCVWRRIALLAPGAQRASVPCQRRVAHDVRVDLVQLGTVGGFGVRIQRKARTSAHTSVSTVSKGKTTRPSTPSHVRRQPVGCGDGPSSTDMIDDSDDSTVTLVGEVVVLRGWSERLVYQHNVLPV